MSQVAIALNNHLNVRTNPDTGERELFGRIGFQTPGPKVDRFTMMNLAAVQRAYEAGQLKDINGESCKPGDGKTPVIRLYARVSLIKSNDQLESVATIETIDGEAEVPAASADEGDDNPF